MKTYLETTEPCTNIAPYWRDLPRSLFGYLEDVVGELTSAHQRVAMVLEIIRVEAFVLDHRCWCGRPPASRKPIARAFIAKSVLNIPTTKDLIERLRSDPRLRRLCGFIWKVESEATFSRAFQELANSRILDKVHEAVVQAHYSDSVVQHVSRDSTAIKVREEPAPKPKQTPREKQKCGRKKKGEARELTRQERQLTQVWSEALAELPTACAIGVKLNSKGRSEYWIGYKGHADVADGGVPLSFWTTSATLHDSQAAIPMMKMTASRVGTIFYQLMDKAYFGELVFKAAKALDQVAIIPSKANPPHPAIPLDKAQLKRFENRTTAERFFSDLKENHGGDNIRVTGPEKVHAHLMCGVLTIFAQAQYRIR